MEIAQALLTFIAIVIGIMIIGCILLYHLNDENKRVCINCKHYDLGLECCWAKKKHVCTDPEYTSCDQFCKCCNRTRYIREEVKDQYKEN